MTKAQLPLFEKNNPSILINLLEWRGEKYDDNPVHNIRPAPKSDASEKTIVSILAVEIAKDVWHYVGVTNIDRLLNHGNGISRTYCERCLKPLFSSNKGDTREQKRAEHLKTCMLTNPDSTQMTQKETLKFEAYAKTQRLPYVMYADTECYLQPDEDSNEITHHKPCAIGLLLVPHPNMKAEPLKIPYTTFTGDNCMKEACDFIEDVGKQIYQWNKVNSYQPVIMTEDQKRAHQQSSKCYICSTEFDDDVQKIVEHDHLTSEYRGAACQECNTKMRLKRNHLPVFFHNLRGYDGHLLCESAFSKKQEWELSVIPQTKEKYLGMTAKFVVDKYNNKGQEVVVKMSITFKDSVQFLSASLDNLVKCLVDIGESKDDPTLTEEQKQQMQEKLVRDKMVYSLQCLPQNAPYSLITSKGIFPYEWFNGEDCLKQTKLPLQVYFYDK